MHDSISIFASFLSKIPLTLAGLLFSGSPDHCGSLPLTLADFTAKAQASSMRSTSLVLEKPTAPFTIALIPDLEKVLAAAGFKCEFFGAFPKFAKSSWIAKMKVALRDVTKKIIENLPLGKYVWLAMRNKSLGGLKELPREVDQIEVDGDWRGNFIRLPNDVCNNQYRIVYCVAQLGEV
ncbi:MAG: hypothetical protein L6406_18700 [Desulfobacterales bacterium]|nr:hypothetical protein [Desulfobacterales bacterium]